MIHFFKSSCNFFLRTFIIFKTLFLIFKPVKSNRSLLYFTMYLLLASYCIPLCYNGKMLEKYSHELFINVDLILARE